MLTTVLDQHMNISGRDLTIYNKGELNDILLEFKAVRFFSPPQMDELKPTPTEIDTLKKFPFLEDSLIDRLKEELPSYTAAVEDVSCDVDIAKWWKSHQNELPAWAEACKLVFLVQPSSAAAEQVFSHLENLFSHMPKYLFWLCYNNNNNKA